MKTFIRSVDFACQGIRDYFSRQRNAKFQAVIGITVIVLGFIVSISPYQWFLVLFCIGLVISLEMINSSIEVFCDMVTTDFHPRIKIIKNVAAGAVLVASLTSLVIGLLIFIPAITDYITTFL